jgi:hypothetical protein
MRVLPVFPLGGFSRLCRTPRLLALLVLAPLIAVPALADDTYCGIVNGRFVTDCPESGRAKDPASPRAAECQRLSSELAGQTGMGSFPATMKKDDLQKLYSRRCNTSTADRTQLGDTPECDRIARDLHGLAGSSVQPALVSKTDLLRQYDMRCAAPPPRERPAVVIIR